MKMGKNIRVKGLRDMRMISESPDGTTFQGKRIKEENTFIKVLPYPADLNIKEDLYTINYLKEVKRLRTLNQAANIHVVNILSTGLTDEEHYPYIESEFIEGPDLEKQLTFPNNPLFRIDEAIDLAGQLADALAHCHNALVRHGKINLNNIRLNPRTGYYVLVNFGQSLLTDQHRKQTISDSQSVEFLAPEQWKGELFFETDIYSVGLVLFQVLTGSVPLNIASTVAADAEQETVSELSIARQINKSRLDNLPLNWSELEKEQETKVPEWLINLVSMCLESDLEKRFKNGLKFKDEVDAHRFKSTAAQNINAAEVLPKPIATKETVAVAPAISDDEKEAEIKRLKTLIIQKDGQLDVLRYQTADYNPDSDKLSISKPVFFTLLALIALLALFGAYSYFFREAETREGITTYTDDSDGSDTSASNLTAEMYADSLAALDLTVIDTAALLRSMPPIPEEETKTEDEEKKPEEPVKQPVVKKSASKPASTTRSSTRTNARRQNPVRERESSENARVFEPPVNKTPRYTLAVSKAYFYDAPDVRSRRPVYLSNSNESEFTATQDSNGFIYVVFFNTEKQITKGWLRKQDLRKIN